MAESRRLSIGVARDNSNFHEALIEILDHQGICYEDIQGNPSTSSGKVAYPVVIIPEAPSGELLVRARQACSDSHNVIVASEYIDLMSIQRSLTGLDEKKRDVFECEINEEELKLTRAIKQAFRKQGLPLVRKWFWPGGANVCCVLSHDIDWLTYSPFHKAVWEGKVGAFGYLKLALASVFGRRDYGWNISSTMKQESKHGFKSSFYFQTSYEVRQDLADESIRDLKAQKFEIGLHAYHSSHKDAKALEMELQKYRDKVGSLPEGLRYHILKFKTPDSWVLEQGAGLKYDATFAYNEYYGFRAGLCFPYHPLIDDNDKSRKLAILELPTGFMDWTALHRKDRGEKVEPILDRVRSNTEKYHGLLLVNFHNTYLNQESFPDIYEVFSNLLDKVSTPKYWVTTASECAKWWQRRTAARPDPKLDAQGTVRFEETGVPLVAEYGDDKIIPLTTKEISE